MSKGTGVDDVRNVNGFMAERGWQGRSCSVCGKTFYFKPSSPMDQTYCGWRDCGQGGLSFQSFLRRKKMITPQAVNATMSGFFQAFGFASVPAMDIANVNGQTDLVIAGVQVFDGILHRGQSVREEKMFIAQPCVRMQFQTQVRSQEGVSTSFVNVCTEKLGVTLSEHLQIVDQWCSVLSKLGLHMNNFVIVMRTSENDWGTGKFFANEFFFVYGGIELGDAAYRVIPQSARDALTISDIGFGLERVVWAINKTASYFDTLSPFTFDGPREMFDACRTLALLALCGIRASNKGPVLQFRRFAKVISEQYCNENIYRIIQCYFDYWSNFMEPSISKESVIQLVRLELERLINLKVSKGLKLPLPNEDETTEAYFHRLVYTHNVGIYELREAIKTCKT